MAEDGQDGGVMTNEERLRIERFSTTHHPNTVFAMQEKLKWWQEEITSGRRCGGCWLRNYDCFCSNLSKYTEKYSHSFDSDNKLIKVLMYYHYQEIGRSANTAHIFESLYPKDRFERLLFGDVEAEAKFIDELCHEAESGVLQTCILYPCSSSQMLSDWINQRPKHATDDPVRIVALDGTYSQASRQWKHLTKYMQLKGHKLPVVKLDLEAGKCVSAYAGIQHQPNKEKICTYQAVVMAMRQAGANPKACDHLASDLHTWIEYLLKSRVKIGKTQLKKVQGMDDFKPADYVQAYLSNHPHGKVDRKNKNDKSNKSNNKRGGKGGDARGKGTGTGTGTGTGKDGTGNDDSDNEDDDDDDQGEGEEEGGASGGRRKKRERPPSDQGGKKHNPNTPKPNPSPVYCRMKIEKTRAFSVFTCASSSSSSSS